MFNPQRPARKSPRLRDYDYGQEGAYFVTICTHNREAIFGDVVNGEMQLSSCGAIIQKCWDDLPKHYVNIELDMFVVMPNHVHGIGVIVGEIGLVGEGLKPSPTAFANNKHGLTEIVRGFKTFSARRINKLRDTPGARVWQRSFHDHIIRSERELNTLRQYIEYNPARWEADRYYGG
jgi:putative transposase